MSKYQFEPLELLFVIITTICNMAMVAKFLGLGVPPSDDENSAPLPY